MFLKPDSLTPIYLQIAGWLEDQIISGVLAADQRVYSQYQLAELFNINPATGAKRYYSQPNVNTRAKATY